MDLKTLPKAELHCHLDGILDPAMAWEIHRDDPAYPIDPGYFEQAYPIEICPTSNLKTGSISKIEEHPVRKARELGLSFSINTDDPGPFECSMESEYALLANVLGFQESDLQRLYANSLEAKFQPKLRINVVKLRLESSL